MIGDRIIAALQHAEKTGRVRSARDLGAKAGLSETYLSRVLAQQKKGVDTSPTAKALAGISSVCGVRLEWLATGEGAMLASGMLRSVSGSETWTPSELSPHKQTALDHYEWPDDVTAEEYDALFVQISRETFAFAPDAPVNWWTMRIRKILSEAKALKRRA